MNQPTTIQNVLAQWGKSQRQVPPQNELLKANILQRLPVNVSSSHSKINFSWLPLVLTGFAVVSFFIVPTLKITPAKDQATSSYIAPPAPAANELYISGTRPMSGQAALQNNARAKSDSYYQSPQPLSVQTTPSSDNREFIKTDYSATIQTRNVQALASHIHTTVRGFDGRIDSSSSSEQSGFISFVVPADKFEAFRSQVKGLVNYRFYKEQNSSQNLLPQKLVIEDQQKQTTDSLNQTATARDELTKNHEQTIASIKYQINVLNSQLAALQKQTTTDPSMAMQIQNQEQDLQLQIQKHQSRLANENNSYLEQLNSYNAQIQSFQNNLDNLNTQTANLMDNVATVNGTISLEYISSWDVFNAYCPPGYWVAGIFLAAAALLYLVDRRKRQFIIP